MVVLDVDTTNVSMGLVLVLYLFCLVCKLTSLVVKGSRWWTPVSTVGGAPGALGMCWGGDAVATSPWTGNGFWNTIGGGPCGARLGWAWSIVLVAS